MITAYLCIFIAALFFASQFVFSKLFQCHSDGSTQANLWMVLMQSVWVLLIFWAGRGFAVAGTPQAVGYALCYTVANIACSLASILAVSMGKLVTVTLYSMIGGQAVPFVYGLIFTGARPTWLAYLGFALILLSSLPNVLGSDAAPAGAAQKAAADSKKRVLFLSLCMVVFFGNGFVSVFSDVNAKSAHGVSGSDFLVLTAFWALGLGALLMLWQVLARRKGGKRGKAALLAGLHAMKGDTAALIGCKVFLLIFGIVGAYTVLNSMGNIFSIRAAAVPGMQSSVQFPLLNALIMILTSILGRIVFKEKIGKRDFVSIALLVGGILLFMLSFVIYGR